MYLEFFIIVQHNQYKQHNSYPPTLITNQNALRIPGTLLLTVQTRRLVKNQLKGSFKMIEFATHNLNSHQPRKQKQNSNSLRIRIKTKAGLSIVPISEILYVEAYTPYSHLHLNDSRIFCGESIRYFEEKLSHYGFLRVHKSILVNVCLVECYHKEGDGSLILKGGLKVNLARGKKRKLLAMLEKYFL